MPLQSVTFSHDVGLWVQYRAIRAMVNRTSANHFGWVFFVGLPLLLVLAEWWFGLDFSSGNLAAFPPKGIFLAGLGLMLFFMPLTHLLNAYSARRRNSSAGNVQTYTISSDAYSVRGASFEVSLNWSAFFKAIETKEFILLFISSRSAHFIPKLALNESDLQAVRAILREKFGPKARLY